MFPAQLVFGVDLSAAAVVTEGLRVAATLGRGLGDEECPGRGQGAVRVVAVCQSGSLISQVALIAGRLLPLRSLADQLRVAVSPRQSVRASPV